MIRAFARTALRGGAARGPVRGSAIAGFGPAARAFSTSDGPHDPSGSSANFSGKPRPKKPKKGDLGRSAVRRGGRGAADPPAPSLAPSAAGPDDSPDHADEGDFNDEIAGITSSSGSDFESDSTFPGVPSRKPRRSGGGKSRHKRLVEFDLTPRELREHLDAAVIRQDAAKKVLSVAICDHYNHVRRCIEEPATMADEYSKPNVLLLGPTGVGKTHLIRSVAKLINVPFVKADATKFSETGYVGEDVEDLVRDLYTSCNCDRSLAQFGIIYVDEVDKLASSHHGHTVNTRGVQNTFLKLMEDTEVNLSSPRMGRMMGSGRAPNLTLNTRHILFIFSGAFSGMNEQLQKQRSEQTIGFVDPAAAAEPAAAATTAMSAAAVEADEESFLKHATTTDFIAAGFEPEFVGRLPVRVACDPLGAGALREILTTSTTSVLNQMRSDFQAWGIEFDVTDGALDHIAKAALTEKTGARGLVTVLERTFRELKYELPSSPVTKFTIDDAFIADPAAALGELLEAAKADLPKRMLADVDRYERSFERDHGVKLRFGRAARKRVVALAVEGNLSVRSVLHRKFAPVAEHFVSLQQKTDEAVVEVPYSAIENPDVIRLMRERAQQSAHKAMYADDGDDGDDGDDEDDHRP